MRKPTRVLLVINDFKKGGVQAEVMYPARILSKDEVQFDVMLLSDVKGFYEEEFRNYGEIYRIPLKRKKTKIQRVFSIVTNYFYVKKKLEEFLKTHSYYDAVHTRHLILNAPCMSAAKKCKVPVRIAYCAVNKPERKEYRDRLYVRLYLKLCSVVLNRCCTHKFGVTQNAADYVFGKNKGVPIKNPTVDFEKFDPEKYQNVLDGKIHLLMVGSYSSRKNQKFAVEVLKALNNNSINANLTFIGYPRSDKETYLPELKRKIKEYGLEKSVTFLPQDSNIPEIMSKSTFLLVPSLQEGLPNVVLEAQKMGLPCFISTDVSDDCDCGLCSFLPLEKGGGYWADRLIEYVDKKGFKKTYPDMSEWDNKKVCEEYLEYWRGIK